MPSPPQAQRRSLYWLSGSGILLSATSPPLTGQTSSSLPGIRRADALGTTRSSQSHRSPKSRQAPQYSHILHFAIPLPPYSSTIVLMARL